MLHVEAVQRAANHGMTIITTDDFDTLVQFHCTTLGARVTGRWRDRVDFDWFGCSLSLRAAAAEESSAGPATDPDLLRTTSPTGTEVPGTAAGHGRIRSFAEMFPGTGFTHCLPGRDVNEAVAADLVLDTINWCDLADRLRWRGVPHAIETPRGLSAEPGRQCLIRLIQPDGQVLQARGFSDEQGVLAA